MPAHPRALVYRLSPLWCLVSLKSTAESFEQISIVMNLVNFDSSSPVVRESREPKSVLRFLRPTVHCQQQ